MLLLCLFFVSFLTKKFFNETSTNILGVSLLGGTRWNTPQSVQTCWNPSEPVQICPDPFQSVQTPFKPVENTFKPVETRYNPFKRVSPPPPPSPPPTPSPFSPFFFFGGGEGAGEGGGGGREATTTTAPPPDFNKKLSKFSHSFFSLLCNLPTLKVSLSPQLKTTKLMLLASQQNSLWHTSKNIYYISPLNIIKISLKKISSLCGGPDDVMVKTYTKLSNSLSLSSSSKSV